MQIVASCVGTRLTFFLLILSARPNAVPFLASLAEYNVCRIYCCVSFSLQALLSDIIIIIIAFAMILSVTLDSGIDEICFFIFKTYCYE